MRTPPSPQRLAPGGLSTAALQRCQVCLRHMSPGDAAAAAAFAAAGGSCPLVLPSSEQPLEPPSLPPAQQQQLLGAALEAVQRSPAAADASLQPALQQLRRRHALLSTCSSLGTACPGASSAQLRAAREAARSLQQSALAGGEGAAGSGALDSCLQQLLTSGCPAVCVLGVAAMLLSLQAQPEQAPQPPATLLGDPDAAAAAQQAVAAAADTAVAASLTAMSGGEAAQEAGAQQQQLSAGDAVQNLFGLLRSLHQQAEPEAPAGDAAGDAQQAAAAAGASAAALDALRQQVWQHLQRKAAAYDGTGGAAETDAHLQASAQPTALLRMLWHCALVVQAQVQAVLPALPRPALMLAYPLIFLQVLELLGSVGTASLWPGWAPPTSELSAAGSTPAAMAGSAHRQALLFTRAAAMLAVEWPDAVQRCRLSAPDFANVQAAEAALLRLVAAAERPEQLRLLLRLLHEVLPDDAFPETAGAEAVLPEAAEAATATAAEEEEETAETAAASTEATDEPVPEAARVEQEQAAGAPAAGVAAAAEAVTSPLHCAWAACLQSLLALRDLHSVLAALDERASQQAQQAHQQPERQQGAVSPPALLTQQEAAALLEAADATQGPAAAAALALLLPYAPLRRPRWQQLLLAVGGSGSAADLAAGLPGLAPLLLVLVQQQPALLTKLAAGDRTGQAQLQLLVSAALVQQSSGGSGYGSPLGGSGCLSLGMAVAAAAAAVLAAARQYIAAAWLAMEASGTPRLLRVLDNGPNALLRLLRSCATGSLAAENAAAAADRVESGAEDDHAPRIATPLAAAALLRSLPRQCSAALDQLAADLQLQ